MPRVFLTCVLLGVARDALLSAHTRVQHITSPAPTQHPHSDEIVWSTDLPNDALRQCCDLLELLPQARIGVDLGDVLATFEHTNIHLSDASRRSEALARAEDVSGVFATHAFVHACDPETLQSLGLEWGATSAGSAQLSTHEPSPGSATPLHRLHVCRRLVEDAIDELDLGTNPALLIKLDERQDLTLATLTTFADTRPDDCAHILLKLLRWLHPIWMRPDAITLCAGLLERDALEKPGLRAELCLLRGTQLRKLGHTEDAISILSELTRDEDLAAELRVRALNELGLARFIHHELDHARRCYTRAIDLAQSHLLPALESEAHRGLAVLEIVGATYMAPETDALIFDHLERALSLAQESGDRQVMMRALGERANLLSVRDPGGAREQMLGVLQLARALHLPHYIGVSLGVLTDLSLRQGRILEAQAFLKMSRQEIHEDDTLGLWFSKTQEALVCLYLREFEDAEALTFELARAIPPEHPQCATHVHELSLLVAVAAGRIERFKQLRDASTISTVRWARICALGDAVGAQGDESDALEALLTRLNTLDSERYHDEWAELIWRVAISKFPAQIVPHRVQPTIAVAPDAGWFLGADGVRVEVSHRPYIHRLFHAFVTQHAISEDGIDTFSLFEAGWPGESIRPAAMKNRVYVGIANLRKLGLQGWLISGPTGYSLSQELSIVQLPGNPTRIILD